MSQAASPWMTSCARAKLNLWLHVIGYMPESKMHAIESLVAFTAYGDTLSFREGDSLTLTIQSSPQGDSTFRENNLVLRAAQSLHKRFPDIRLGAFLLDKRLPIASGLGGGSSDAAAALRMLAVQNDLDHQKEALYACAESLGADVPACLSGGTRIIYGKGECLGSLINLPECGVVLVNPRVPVATPHIFSQLAAAPIEEVPDPSPCPLMFKSLDELVQHLLNTRNDLEAITLRTVPDLDRVPRWFKRDPRCCFVRMSGSGASFYALYRSRAEADDAVARIAIEYPEWWSVATWFA